MEHQPTSLNLLVLSVDLVAQQCDDQVLDAQGRVASQQICSLQAIVSLYCNKTGTCVEVYEKRQVNGESKGKGKQNQGQS